jgi:phage-related protein
MLKKLFNKGSSGVKNLFNKGAGDAKQLFNKASKGIDQGLNKASQIANQVDQGVNQGLNQAGKIANQVGNYAGKAGMALTALSPLLAPVLGPEMLGAGELISSVSNASKSAGGYINQGQQMRKNISGQAHSMIQDAQNAKHNLIQATKPPDLSQVAPAVNFA